jgi:DNA-binding CsgD family transcriptional regulator
MEGVAHATQHGTAGDFGIVGRERDLATLRDVLTHAVRGNGHLVLISGEAGIGKTALVGACATMAAEHDALVLSGCAYDLTTTPPYGPWRETVSVIPPDGCAPPPSFISAMRSLNGQAVVFEEAREYFAELAAERLVLLALEDLHWADHASLELLRYLARGIAGRRLVIIVTYRDDELSRHNPLFTLLPLLIREASAARIDLRRLDEADTSVLVRQRYRLQPADEARLVQYLHARTDGNPLFLHETLRMLEAERILQSRGEGWTLGELLGLTTPALAKQLVERRLTSLDEASREVLLTAAVIGEDVPLDQWRSISGMSEDDFNVACERIIASRVMSDTPAGSVRFTHAIVRQALYEEIALPRRRWLHQRFAEAQMGHPAADPDTIAHHLRQAGDARAVDWLIRAGERAERASAWATAAERYETALSLREAAGVDAARQGWLCYHIARLWRHLDPGKSLRYFEDAERLAIESGDSALVAFAIFDRGSVYGNLNDYQSALAGMRDGLAAFDELARSGTPLDPLAVIWGAEVLPAAATSEGGSAADFVVPSIDRRSLLAGVLTDAGYFAKAHEVIEPLIERIGDVRAGDHLEQESYAWLQWALGAIHSAMGQPESVRDAFERAHQTLRSLNYHPALGVSALVDFRESILPYWTTRLDERRRLESIADYSYRRAAGVWESASSRECPLFLSVLLLEGQWTQARELALARVNQHVGQFSCAAALGWLARYRDQPDDAWAWVFFILPDGSATEPGTKQFFRALDTQRLAIELALDAGDERTARAWLDAHDRWLAWSGVARGRSEGQLMWARYFRTFGDGDRARRHGAEALTCASNPCQPLALLAAHRFVGEMDTATKRFGDAETNLTESLALAEACAAPYEQALTLLALAELRAALGRREVARSLLDRVQAICEPLDAQPALQRARELRTRLACQAGHKPVYPDGLTGREVEILRLIAAGMNTHAIAAALFISPRTVERHISNLYTKAGVNSRAEAALYAVRCELA